MEAKKPTRGGARKGAGRPRILKEGEDTNPSLNLEERHYQAFKKAGGGNASAGARKLAEEYIAKSKPTP